MRKGRLKIDREAEALRLKIKKAEEGIAACMYFVAGFHARIIKAQKALIDHHTEIESQRGNDPD